MIYLFFAFAVVCIVIALTPRGAMQMILVAAWVVMAASGIVSVGWEFIRRL